MRSAYRAITGFGLGLMLLGLAFQLGGIGHGTFTPMLVNAPMLAILPEVGIALSLIGTPLLWALYFFLIPKISSRPFRVSAVTTTALVHLGTAVWMSSRDRAFGRMFESSPWVTISYFGVLIVGLLTLGLFAAIRSETLS